MMKCWLERLQIPLGLLVMVALMIALDSISRL